MSRCPKENSFEYKYNKGHEEKEWKLSREQNEIMKMLRALESK